VTDNHGNKRAEEGVDRCPCGAKYWEHDRCVSCGEPFRLPTYDDLSETPIALAVARLQNAGRDIYIAGFSPRHALVVDNDNSQVSVAPHDQCNGLGRWECSTNHLAAYPDLYLDRFRIRP
jgi:hypothetical protein